MNNVARKIVPISMIDLEQFEAEIRADERRRLKAKRLHREEIRRRKMILLLKYLAQKLAGIILIVGSIMIAKSNLMYDPVTGYNDGTFMLLTIPLGLAMLFVKDLFIE